MLELFVDFLAEALLIHFHVNSHHLSRLWEYLIIISSVQLLLSDDVDKLEV